MWESDDVNYYEHHLGDYMRDAAHLSLMEEGVYRRLIDAYYVHERPLPLDIRQCKKLARVSRNPAEHRAVEMVLRLFFVEAPDGYHQKRCDEEIQKFRAKSESARNSANARWAHSDRNANASNGSMRPQSEGNALQSPISSNHKDIPTQTLPAEREGLSLRERGLNRRALGTNPRANGANPRALGTNPRADRDERKSELDEARLVWSELIASGGARPKRDHRIQAALDAIGGWQAVRVRTDHDELRLQRGFCEAYNRGGESAPRSHRRQPLDPDDSWEREEAAR
jgi:uncharacterized protein YdaU (DUF1376 family)